MTDDEPIFGQNVNNFVKRVGLPKFKVGKHGESRFIRVGLAWWTKEEFMFCSNKCFIKCDIVKHKYGPTGTLVNSEQKPFVINFYY